MHILATFQLIHDLSVRRLQLRLKGALRKGWPVPAHCKPRKTHLHWHLLSLVLCRGCQRHEDRSLSLAVSPKMERARQGVKETPNCMMETEEAPPLLQGLRRHAYLSTLFPSMSNSTDLSFLCPPES